jgi:amino acid transporter
MKNIKGLLRTKPIHEAKSEVYDHSMPSLKKNLSLFDLTSLGIAAIIGAGIFSTIGTAAAQGGPAVSVLFIFTAIACGFSALCYARFASSIPVSGSA